MPPMPLEPDSEIEELKARGIIPQEKTTFTERDIKSARYVARKQLKQVEEQHRLQHEHKQEKAAEEQTELVKEQRKELQHTVSEREAAEAEEAEQYFIKEKKQREEARKAKRDAAGRFLKSVAESYRKEDTKAGRRIKISTENQAFLTKLHNMSDGEIRELIAWKPSDFRPFGFYAPGAEAEYQQKVRFRAFVLRQLQLNKMAQLSSEASTKFSRVAERSESRALELEPDSPEKNKELQIAEFERQLSARRTSGRLSR